MNIFVGCLRGNLPYFEKTFLVLNYIDMTKNTYVRSPKIAEVLTRGKRVLFAVPPTVPV
jgi:hypothetical protein